MFSSNCCCLTSLNKSVMVEDEDKEGLERREVTRDVVEAEEEEDEWDEPEEMEAAAATAAALFSCRREWEIKARSTLGARGRVEGAVDPPEAPREKLVLVPHTSEGSPQGSSSGLLFGFLCMMFMPLVLLPLAVACPISDLPVVPNGTPNKDGGSSESESSGFCSRWRRKCTLRLPRVVKRLRHTGHWYGRSPVCERKCIWREESLLNIFPQKRQACWSRPVVMELDAGEESAETEMCWEFGATDTVVATDEFRRDLPPCPLTEAVFGDFS